MRMTNIKIMGIAHNSVVDGVGIRDVIFTAGCPHHCYGCHNPETWNINNGKDYTIQDIIKELNTHCNLTLSGGEPFIQAKQLTELILEYKKIKPELNVWVYSGYTYEEIVKDPIKLELLRQCNVLVDGHFELDKKIRGLKFRGSANQRIIDIQASLKAGNARFSPENIV